MLKRKAECRMNKTKIRVGRARDVQMAISRIIMVKMSAGRIALYRQDYEEMRFIWASIERWKAIRRNARILMRLKRRERLENAPTKAELPDIYVP